jgi:molecular chaperone HtpG
MYPYRGRRDQGRELRDPKPGLVTDMVRQFADPYAFLRELVQNSMDAGTKQIEVSLSRDADGEVRTSVTDSGSGMTPAIIENALLTLFSSSKQNDPSKIGKYGVGFISVLALDPMRVEVDTWRSEGAWRVRIQRDHSYVVEELEPRTGTGTVVTLFHSMDSARFDRHATAAREALRRWCRHARVPISLTITDYSTPSRSWNGRVDVPIAVHAAVTVSVRDGEDLIVLGPSAGSELLDWPAELPPHENAERFIGFYNRGLTLYESSTETFAGFEGLRVKISSPKLEHTLSRDNVRREKHFDELLEGARRLAGRALPGAVEQAMREQAQAMERGEDHRAYLALLSASERVGLGPKRVFFPLADPIEGETVQSASGIVRRSPWREPLLTSTQRDALTAAFASAGRPVVLCTAPAVVEHLGRLYDTSIASRCELAHQRHLVIQSLAALSPGDDALCRELARALGAAGIAIESASLGFPIGARPLQAVLAREPPKGVISLDQAAAAARKWGHGDHLVLDVRHEAVQAARGRAQHSPRAAAHLLARVLLLERKGVPSARVNDALLRQFVEPHP